MVILRRAIDFKDFAGADDGATSIVNQYARWKDQRIGWEKSKRELREYVYQTDTTQTRNNRLPWMNTTTRPKLCQLRDNLHANYISALSLSGNFLQWEAATQDSADAQKAQMMTAYVRTKMEDSNAYDTISQLLYDYIDFGIAIAGVEYVSAVNKDGEDNTTEVYVGPRLVRFHPEDVVFDLTAASFDAAPKITRSVVTLGDLHRLAADYPEYKYDTAVVAKMLANRSRYNGLDARERNKVASFAIEGFGSLNEYYNSGCVELLTFEGDYFDQATGVLTPNAVIVVADRAHVISVRTNPSWLGKSSKRAVVWRPRPDNLLGMGPLDNLVGLQYRIDHLENLKADAFDQVVYPIVKEKGLVQDWEFKPGERIRLGEGADVGYLQPDGTFLNADSQIAILENTMEEMAGAPKTAMGIRTPGEKTAYEVQQLENAAGRIFQVKITQFERCLLEPLMNLLLESGRRNMDQKTIIRSIDDDLGAQLFTTINKEDIVGSGRLRPLGARHFAERAKLVQELSTFFGPGNIGQDAGVRPHFSGKQIAKLFNSLLDLDKFAIYQENAQVTETAETQSVVAEAQRQMERTQATDTGLEGEAQGLTDEIAAEELAAQGIDPAMLETMGGAPQ